MQLLEKFWEGTTNAVNGVLGGLDRGLTVFFGSANSRQIKRFTELARQIGELEPKMMALSDSELRRAKLSTTCWWKHSQHAVKPDDAFCGCDITMFSSSVVWFSMAAISQK
jgi:hypothetical protein